MLLLLWHSLPSSFVCVSFSFGSSKTRSQNRRRNSGTMERSQFNVKRKKWGNAPLLGATRTRTRTRTQASGSQCGKPEELHGFTGPPSSSASCRTLRRQETKRGKRAAAAAKRNSRMRRAAITKSYTTKGKKLNVLHRGVAIAHSVWVGGSQCESECVCVCVCVCALWDVGGL